MERGLRVGLGLVLSLPLRCPGPPCSRCIRWRCRFLICLRQRTGLLPCVLSHLHIAPNAGNVGRLLGVGPKRLLPERGDVQAHRAKQRLAFGHGHQCTCFFVCLFVCLSCLLVGVHVCLLACLLACLLDCFFVRLIVCLLVFPDCRSFVRSFVSLYVCLRERESVCVCVG